MSDEATVPWAPGSADPKIAFAEFHLHLREITPRLRVTPALLGLNVLVFGAMVAAGVSAISPTADNALGWGANYGPRTLGGEPWRLLTNFFVHFGLLHLAANMFAFWGAGALVERMFGPLAFAVVYFTAGITGSLASVIVHPAVVSAGASGAVFGVYGALAAFVLRQRGVIPPVVFARLRNAAGTFIAYNIFFGAAHSGIDNAAHVGGLLGGAAAGALLIRPLLPGRTSDWRRPAAIAAGAIALASAVVLAWPRPLVFAEVAQAFGKSETAALDLFNVAAKSFDAHQIGTGEMADRIEKGILPPWHAARVKLERQIELCKRGRCATPNQQRVLALLGREATIRETDWTRMVAALRIGDADTATRIASDNQTAMKAIIDELETLKP